MNKSGENSKQTRINEVKVSKAWDVKKDKI